jgi:maltose O-acetyltransferase
MKNKFSWIMSAAVIAPGIMIGDEAVVATVSVVTKDVPHRNLVAGVPAKVVKNLEGLLE